MFRFLLLSIISCLITLQARHSYGQNHIIGSGNFTGCSGRFYDSGGGSVDYGNNELFTETYCSGTVGQCIQIDFSSFETQANRDALYVYDGTSTTGPLIGIFSGSLAPFTVTSSTGCITVQWESDGGTVLPGWFGVFSCVPCSGGTTGHSMGMGNLNTCSEDLFDSGGSSGSYNDFEYYVETYCSNDPGLCIQIEFNSFATEAGADILYIYDGNSNTAPLIGSYSGSLGSFTVSGTSGCVTFEWSSNGLITSLGWDATLSCVNCPTCTDGILNGLEIGVDCGGPTCPPCPCSSYPVPNDEACCATPVPVNPAQLCTTTVPGTVLNATQSFNTNGCFGTADDDVWFEFVATNSVHYIDLLNVTGSTTDLYHSVYDGTCSATTGPLLCSDPNSSTVGGLIPGNTYYLRIYTWTSTGSQNTTFDVCITSPPPPPTNDEVCSSINVDVNPTQVCASVTPGYITGATQSPEPNGCFGTADDDVWFDFVATNTSHYISLLNVSGSTTDLYHSVYAGPCSNPGTELICSDPNNSTVTGLIPGNTYYIRVYTWTSTPGQNVNFNVCVATPPPPPTNDDPCDAITASVNPDQTCTLINNGYCVGATQSLPGCVGTADDDVWFVFTALAPIHDIILSNIGGTTDLVHEVFSGPCTALTSISCSDPNTSTVTGLTVGDQYYVRVYTYSSIGSNSSFDLCINSPCGLNSSAPDCNLNYSMSTIPYAPVSYNTGAPMTFSDDIFASSFTPIGFDFCFDGVVYSECLVSSNGYIMFPGCYSTHDGSISNPGGYSPWSISQAAPNNTDAPTNAVMLTWQDLNPNIGGTIRTHTFGTAPNRVFVVTYQSISMFSCTSTFFSAQAMFHETTNNIEFHIGEKPMCPGWNSGAGIMGLNNFDGTIAAVPNGYNYPTQWSVLSTQPEAHLFASNCTNGECIVILQTEIVQFTGEAIGSDNILSWKTVSEDNLSHFVVERSINGGISFEAIAQQPSKGNGSTYTYVDQNMSDKEQVYYRLRMVDHTEKNAYSKVINITRDFNSVDGVFIFPNPANELINVNLSNARLSEQILVFDNLGQILHLTSSYDKNIVSLNTKGLIPGLYMMKISLVNGRTIHKKFIIN